MKNLISNRIYNLIKKLYPITRSLTGNGNRETLSIINDIIPIETFEVPSGTKAFDWEVPKEWNIKNAYIKDAKGNKIVDFKNNNLHIVNYSMPIRGHFSFDELKKKIHTDPKRPNIIPYCTTYYNEDWGFCMKYNNYIKLQDGEYEVLIDSELKHGTLSYGELFIPGSSKEEIVFSTYICHPSMCNDNLSGIAVQTFLAKKLLGMKLKYSYRFLFIPETIGSILWLSLNKDKFNLIKFGLVITCCGDEGELNYKKTRRGDTSLDIIMEHLQINTRNFVPRGSDERQYCSPGINLDFGVITRTPYTEFEEYHTSKDDLNYIKPDKLNDTFEHLLKIVDLLEDNRYYISIKPNCEPLLGKYELYRKIGGQIEGKLLDEIRIAILWALNYSDGFNSLLDISYKSNIDIKVLEKAFDILHQKGLIKCI